MSMIARKVLLAVRSQASLRNFGYRWQNFAAMLQAVKMLLLHGFPEVLLTFGVAPGDDLLCTAVGRELRRRGIAKLWIMSKYPALFAGRRDIRLAVPFNRWLVRAVERRGKKFYSLEYAKFHRETDRSDVPTRHIIGELCSRAGITGEVLLRPYLDLTESEQQSGAWAKGQIAIQSSGLSGVLRMQNKQWFPERFQEVVDALRGEYGIVQIGSKDDPLLTGAKDLRGMTSIRATAAILRNAVLYVGNVGFLMHLARAVDCPSVVLFGGREAPWQSGYNCNINLYSPLSCAPCWRWNTCDYERKCMTDISADMVTQAVRELILRPRDDLPVEKMTIVKDTDARR